MLSYQKYLTVILIYLLNSCSDNHKIKGVILDEESRKPIDSVAISEKDLQLNSYPFPFKLSGPNGEFEFVKTSNDSLLFFWKPGYKSFKLKFDHAFINDTVFLTKNRQ